MMVLSPRPQEMTDVVIVGCGAGGGVVAKELGEAGLSCVVLEAGPRFDPERDYRTNQFDFELTASRVFEADDPRRDLYTLGGTRRFHYSRAKGVGGSTLIFGAVCPRLHQSDFRVFSEDGVADDWPITYEDLEPYYCAVEYELGVSGHSGPGGNPFDPPRSLPYPTPPHELNDSCRVIKRGAERLGLSLAPAPLAIPTRRWGDRPPCDRAGACGLGCRIRAKSSIDVTYVPKAEATGRVQIRPRCMAREVRIGLDGRARSVVYFDPSGREREIGARVVVLAGNAVETPRLLLLSTSALFPDGLANSSGLVGRYFMEHLMVYAVGVFPEWIEAWRGPVVGGIVQDFYATRPRNGFARGWSVEVDNNDMWPLAVARRVSGWGPEHKARVRRLFGHLVALCTVGEQLPDPRNSVTLDPAVRDCYGLPVPRLTNEVGNNDQAMIKAMAQCLRELLEAAGAVEVLGPEVLPGGGAHYLGTCRMGTDPERSVIDPWCRTHDVPNLYIADSSVFVTGGAVNPALTISALATRTAEGIIHAFRHGEL